MIFSYLCIRFRAISPAGVASPCGGGSLTGLHEDREVAPRDVPFYWDVSRVANNGSGFLFH